MTVIGPQRKQNQVSDPKERELYIVGENWIDENQKVEMSVPEGKEFNTPYPIPTPPQKSQNKSIIEQLEKKKSKISRLGFSEKKEFKKPN